MDEDAKPEVDAWLSEPFTKLALERVKKEMEPAMLHGLLHACKASTDPKVTAWYARYVATQELREFLTKGLLST